MIWDPQDSVHNQRLTEIWVGLLLNGSSAATITLLLWDFLITFADEVRYIWHWGAQTHIIRWLFFFLRYFGLSIQTIRAFMSFYLSSTSSAPLTLCKMWYVFQMVTGEALIASVELLLIIRVYALYNRARKLGMILLFFLAVEFTAICTITWLSIPHLVFGNACVVHMDLDDVVYFGVAALLSQCLVWLITAYKCYSAIAAGWGRTPVVLLLIRDGSLTFVALFGVVIGQTFLTALVDKSTSTAVNTYIVTIMSIAGCRIILNMQSLSDRPEDEDDPNTPDSIPNPSFELTTQIDISDSTSVSSYASHSLPGGLSDIFPRISRRITPVPDLNA